MTEKKEEKQRKETELEALKTQKELINKLEATVGLTNTKSDPLCTSLGTFEDVWQNVCPSLFNPSLILILQYLTDHHRFTRN
jgi:hypothetical protein